MRTIAWCCAWLLVLCRLAGATTVSLSCPTFVTRNNAFTTDLLINTFPDPVVIGAYSVTVTYDPTVVTITSIGGGTTTEFSGAPTTNTGSFTTGTTNIAAFQNSSLVSPTGLVNVARIHWQVAPAVPPPMTTTLTLTLNSLFDPNSTPIPAMGFGCTMAVAIASSVTINTHCP